MSIASINATGRVSTSTADSSASVAASARTAPIDPALTKEDAAFQTPTPPRFPWLSRLSQELESAARQKPAFQPAPILGDNVDKSA